MEIMPNSTIHFLRNIPFDNDYNDTIYFESPNEQYEYFTKPENGFVKYTLNEQYYIRHSANVIDVELPLEQIGRGFQVNTAESLYDCNYIVFRNTNFIRDHSNIEPSRPDPKWFYAFVTEIEYVNNEVARVTFEIDAMQTWMFDYELEQCFVEREHSSTDVEGQNIIAENLDVGETYLTQYTYNKLYTINDLYVYILYARYYDGAFIRYAPLRLLNNVPTTLGVHTVKINQKRTGETDEQGIERGLTELYNFLNLYIGDGNNDLTADDIVAIYLYPYGMTAEGFLDTIHIDKPVYFKYISEANETTDNVYRPKNKKLLTFPYIMIEVSNHEGTVETYKYEYFMDKVTGVTPVPYQYVFGIVGADAPSPAMCIYPINYKPSQPFIYYNNTGTEYKNDGYDYGVTISDFQQCGWVGDAFKAWWAQNKNGAIASSVGGTMAGLAQLGAGLITKNPYLTGMGVASTVASVYGSMGKYEDAKNKTPIVNGLSNTISLPISMNYFGYTIRIKTISAEYAQIIDEYFSMFGYATHRVKKPNTHVRERCTYTQTKGCTIKGKLPSLYQEKICKIFDNGIRFWDKNVQVGVYKDENGNLYPNACLE